MASGLLLSGATAERALRGSADSSCHIVALTPDRCPAWERYVLAHPQGTLFHTLAWRDAVSDSFGHAPWYRLALRGERVAGVLPAFRLSSRIAGRMLVSVPYGVGGGILADDGEAAAALFAQARAAAEESGCSSIDLRSATAAVPGVPVVDRYFGFERELPDRVEDIPAWLPRKARAAGRNAREKFGLTVAFGDEHLTEVWRLYGMSMRRLASLTYPWRFFRRLMECTPERHWVSLVCWEGRPVAGLVTFLFRDRVMPYFVGVTDAARRCSAANFVYLTLMERAVAAGYRVFDFGRTRRDNTGSFEFKRLHGFEPRPLGYQCYTPPGRRPPDLSPTSPSFAVARRVWPWLPLWFTRAVGARLARHIPG